MYFVHSGSIYLPTRSLRDAGASGYFWGSTAHPADIRYASRLLFNPTTIYPSYSDNRHASFALRKTSLHGSFMYFVRSSIINLQYGSIRFADSHGLFWSSTSSPISPLSTFNLAVYPKSTLYPSDSTSRAYAYSLRLISPN